MKKVIYIKYIEEEEISDLDLDFVDDILGNNPEGHDYDTIDKSDFRYSGNADKIEIDNLIEILEGFKKKGANYVEFINHFDHHGYILNSLDAREATKEQIQTEKNNNKVAKELAKKIEIDRMEKALIKLKKL